MKNSSVVVSTFAVTSALYILSGCLSTPTERYDAAKKKEATVQKSQATNSEAQVRQGVAAVKATQYALNQDQSTNNQYTATAKQTLEMSMRAFEASGLLPTSTQVMNLYKMVDNLLSTNAMLVAQGEAAKRVYLADLAQSEQKAQGLQAKLDAVEAKLDKINAENASAADWIFRIKEIFWWVVIGGGIMLALRVAVAAAGATGNPIGALGTIPDFLIGKAFSGVSNIFSHAKKYAGVVGTEFQDVYQGTVKAIGNTLNSLEKEDIESDVLKTHDPNATFSFNQVKTMLEAHSEAIAANLKADLSTANAGNQALVNQAQVAVGLKPA